MCALLMISSFYGIFWNKSRYDMADFYSALLMAIYFIHADIIESPWSFPYYIFFIGAPSNYRIGLVSSIISSVITIASVNLVLSNFLLKELRLK